MKAGEEGGGGHRSAGRVRAAVGDELKGADGHFDQSRLRSNARLPRSRMECERRMICGSGQSKEDCRNAFPAR